MAAKRKVYSKFQCQECKRINYFVHRSKKLDLKLALKKYCRFCKKHTPHKETRK